MRHGSLFSGIGGFDLAAEWMGWDNVFHCEWMPFPRKVLSHYWPDAISYNDITTTDFRQHRGQIDILTGGFPCQPYSAAGKRLGKEDSRHLWPEMLRAIREISPRWVVGENVRGLTNWNGGVVFDEVQSDLEFAGYEVLPFLLPAVAVNAPHRRDRIWFVAYSESSRSTFSKLGESESRQQIQTRSDINRFEGLGNVANTNSNGLNERNSDNEEYAGQGWQYAQRDTQQSNGNGDASDTAYCGCRGGNCKRCANGRERIFQDECTGGKMGRQIKGCCGKWHATDTESAGSERQCEHRQGQVQFDRRNNSTVPANWQDFPTQSPICGGDDGLPAELDGITFPKWRAESIKGYGNAIVPQVALQIFKAIQQYEAL